MRRPVLSPNDKEILNNLAQKRTIDEVKVIPKGFKLFDLPEFTIITLGVGLRFILNFFFISLGYFLQNVSQRILFIMNLYFVILIVISAAMKKVITIMKTSDYFLPKIEIRSKPQNGSVVIMLMKEELYVKKGRQLEKYNNEAEGWIESIILASEVLVAYLYTYRM
jgi:hypothetical protein